MNGKLLIAIDGPAASGKSSTGSAVARALGLQHVDSGALYRAVTWSALQANATEAMAVIAAAEASRISFEVHADQNFVVLIGGHDAEARIRAEAVTANVSAISAIPAVRDWVNLRLRAVLKLHGGVMDGRDIGTVVFPDADLKVFLTASPEARARRRLLQRGPHIDPVELGEEVARLAERDRLDSSRVVAPLRQATDARYLDTTEMTFDQQVGTIVGWAKGLT